MVIYIYIYICYPPPSGYPPIFWGGEKRVVPYIYIYMDPLGYRSKKPRLSKHRLYTTDGIQAFGFCEARLSEPGIVLSGVSGTVFFCLVSLQ